MPELTKLTMGSFCFSRLTPPHGGVSITYKLATSLSKGEILESGQLQFLPHRLKACSKIEEMQISLCHGLSWQIRGPRFLADESGGKQSGRGSNGSSPCPCGNLVEIIATS
ncbi:hypothetical protein ACSS6W_006828 [Trichoderma asperelloides]